jgi:hypothetical protein
MTATHRRLRPLLPARRCWAHLSNMDITALDLFRYCRFLRHVGKVRCRASSPPALRRQLCMQSLRSSRDRALILRSSFQIMVLFVLVLILGIYASTMKQ